MTEDGQLSVAKTGDTDFQEEGEVLVTDLVPLWICGVSEHSGLGLADKVSIGVHLQGAV